MNVDGIMCSNSSMLGHIHSKLVENWQKTQIYTHLKHGCHVWHAQRAGYGHFFFQTVRISCGEWVEEVRSLRNGFLAIWTFDKFCTGPPIIVIWCTQVYSGWIPAHQFRCLLLLLLPLLPNLPVLPPPRSPDGGRQFSVWPHGQCQETLRWDTA